MNDLKDFVHKIYFGRKRKVTTYACRYVISTGDSVCTKLAIYNDLENSNVNKALKELNEKAKDKYYDMGGDIINVPEYVDIKTPYLQKKLRYRILSERYENIYDKLYNYYFTDKCKNFPLKVFD